MSGKRYRCLRCNGDIQINRRGRFLFHYTGPAGVGMQCPNSGQPIDPAVFNPEGKQ